jgi:hypothetical protein
MKKKCIYCEQQKDVEEFPRHSSYQDGLDTRCRKCIYEHRTIRKELKKIAPNRPKFCECCGKIPKKWCLDHDHCTDEFRGWICEPCNTGIGRLGDDVEGIVKALNYLLNAKNRNRLDTAG